MIIHSNGVFQGAVEMLELKGVVSGMFIVRPSKRQEGWHALSLAFQRTPYHYEIKNTVRILSYYICQSVCLSVSLFLSVTLFTYTFFPSSTKMWRGYIFTAVCLSVCECVCLALFVNKIPAERMNRFGSVFC